jgi:hypothetical protein
VIILSAFAALWCILGFAGGGIAPTFYWVPLILSALLIVMAVRLPRDAASGGSEGRRIGRLVGIASGIEGLLIFLAVIILANVNASDLAIAVIAIIVGTHFLPLARWLPAPSYNATALLLIALGAIGLWLPPAHRDIVVGVGAACILWATAIIALTRYRRALA